MLYSYTKIFFLLTCTVKKKKNVQVVPRKELSVEKRSAVVALRNAVHSLREIVRLENVCLVGVHYSLNGMQVMKAYVINSDP